MFLLRSRRAAALSLGLALFLVLPIPSQALDFNLNPATAAVRVWTWLESLGIVKPVAPLQRAAAPWRKEGSAIDPDGRTVPGSTPTTRPASAMSDQGMMIDPASRN